MAVDVSTEDAFKVGRETALLPLPLLAPAAAGLAPYDVSSDGSRFLVPVPIATAAAATPNADPIVVVLNWTSRLRGR